MIAGTLSAITLSGGRAEAYVVTVNNQTYDITTFVGSYDNDVALLQSQPWWGDGSVVSDFAAAVGSNLGSPNGPTSPSIPQGPYFAYQYNPSGSPPDIFNAYYNFNTALPATGAYDPATPFTYAKAIPVPAPLPILGASAAFTSVRRFRAMSRSLHRLPKA